MNIARYVTQHKKKSSCKRDGELPCTCPSLQHLCLEQDNSKVPKCCQEPWNPLEPSSPCAPPRLLSAHLVYHLDHLFPLSFTWGCQRSGAQKWCGGLVFLPGAGGSTGEISRHREQDRARPEGVVEGSSGFHQQQEGKSSKTAASSVLEPPRSPIVLLKRSSCAGIVKN